MPFIVRPDLARRLRRSLADSPFHIAESGSYLYGLKVCLGLLSTPPHGDAVTSDVMSQSAIATFADFHHNVFVRWQAHEWGLVVHDFL